MSCPMANIRFRSSPKSLMRCWPSYRKAWRRSRCEIGWPISTLMPLTWERRSRTSAMNSARERSSSTNGASISEAFTPRACSSSSARPVLRATVWISGTVSRISSTVRPIRSLSGKEIPGWVAMLMVSEPSLNPGRKLRPIPRKSTTPATNNTHTEASTPRLCPITHCRARR